MDINKIKDLLSKEERGRRLRFDWIDDASRVQALSGQKARTAVLISLDFTRPPDPEREAIFGGLDGDVFDLISDGWHGDTQMRFLRQQHAARNLDPADLPALPEFLQELGLDPAKALVQAVCLLNRKGQSASDDRRNGLRMEWYVRERLPYWLPEATENPAVAWRAFGDALVRIGLAKGWVAQRPCVQCRRSSVDCLDPTVSRCRLCRHRNGDPEPNDPPTVRPDDVWAASDYRATLPDCRSVAEVEAMLTRYRLSMGLAWSGGASVSAAREPDYGSEALGWLFYEGHYGMYDPEFLLRGAALAAADRLVREQEFSWRLDKRELFITHPRFSDLLPVASLLKDHGQPRDSGDDEHETPSVHERYRAAFINLSRAVWPPLTPTTFIAALRQAPESLDRWHRDKVTKLERKTKMKLEATWASIAKETHELGRHIRDLVESLSVDADGEPLWQVSTSEEGHMAWISGNPAAGGFNLDLDTFALPVWKPVDEKYHMTYYAKLLWVPGQGWRVWWDAESGGSAGEENESANQEDGDTPPAIAAAEQGELETLQRLIEEDPATLEANDGTLDLMDGAPCTPLVAAAGEGHAAMVAWLLERGAKLFPGRRARICPALLRAASGGHTEVVRLLLERGAPVEAVADGEKKQFDPGALAEKLQQRPEDPEAAKAWAKDTLQDFWSDITDDDEQTTPLQAAAQMGRADTVRLLLAHGADWRKSTLQGTPLHLCWNSPDTMEALLAAGAEVDIRNRVGQTPFATVLQFAAGFSKTTPETGASVDDEYTREMAAMGHAAHRCLEILADHGADFNARDHDGKTPFMTAAADGSPELLDWLLSRGADPKARDNDGRTALDYAEERGNRVVYEKLVALLGD